MKVIPALRAWYHPGSRYLTNDKIFRNGFKDVYCRGRRATLVLASHNMAEVERLADRVIMLENGRIIADETPPELIKRFGRANLEEVFLAIARRGVTEGEATRSSA